MKIKLLPLILSCLLFSGCVETVLTKPFMPSSSETKPPVTTGPQLQVEALAESLYQNLKDKGGVKDASGHVLLIATFVDSSDFDKTNRLGRLVSEELIAKMFSYGFQIVEFRATRTLLLKEKEGDFGLSREVEKLRDSYDAEFIILGTYSEAADSVFINARLVDLETAHILSASSQEILKTDEIVYLMEDGQKKKRNSEPLRPSVYER